VEGDGERVRVDVLPPAHLWRDDIQLDTQKAGHRVGAGWPDDLGQAGNSSHPVALPPQLGCWRSAPFVPHLPQRAAPRSRSLEAFGPHRMIHGASAVGA